MFKNENDRRIRKEKEKEAKTYLIGRRNESMWNRRPVGGGATIAPPYVLRNRSTEAKDYENGGSVNKNGKEMNSEKQKSKKREKPSFYKPKKN